MKLEGLKISERSSHLFPLTFANRPSLRSRCAKPASRSLAGLTAQVLIALLAFSFLFLTSGVGAFGLQKEDRKDKDANANAYRDAKKAMRGGKFGKALEIYSQLLERDPKDIPAHLGAALAYIKESNYNLSYEHASQVLKLDSGNARAHALAGLALLRSGLISEAILSLNESFRFDPKEPLAWGAAAEIDYYEGRAKDAREKSLRAFSLDSDEADYLITYARASSRVEAFSEAADAYERFLEVAPETDTDRRARIRGLITFYRRLTGVEVHELSGARSTEIPFLLGADRRPYIKVRINGRTGTFVVDTGSGFTVISKEAAKKFGVSEIARGGTSQGVGGDGKFEIVYGLIRSLQLGEAKIKSIPCFIRPFHGAKDRPAEERADGFIGLSVLSHYLTAIDYKSTSMTLDRDMEKAAKVLAAENATVVPFRTTQNGLISIETELDGSHRINAILDSGASSTVISTAAVRRLNLRDNIIKGQTVRVVGAAGVSENVELLFIRHCRVADLLQHNLRALVLDFNAINETSGFEQSGILGGDFLRHFRVTIDFNKAQLALQPLTAAITRE